MVSAFPEGWLAAGRTITRHFVTTVYVETREAIRFCFARRKISEGLAPFERIPILRENRLGNPTPERDCVHGRVFREPPERG
jgi:hypothetical protein